MKTEKIHRGNYEEYFLLYVDNELSAEDKKLVEDFVETNIDLKPELETLLDTKLTDEDISFAWKDGLLKSEAASIEELQLMFLDDELAPEDKSRLNKIHQTNPEAYASFELLKQTKLPEVEIFYPHKNKLYKRSTPVVFLRWIAPAAAAAVLIFVFLQTNTNTAVQDPLPERVIAENHSDVTNDEAPRITEKETVKTDEEIIEKKPASTVPVHTNANPVIEEENNQPNTENIVLQEPVIITEHTPEVVVPEKITNDIAITIKADYVQDVISETIINDEPEQARKPLRGIIRKASRIYNKVTSPDKD